MIGTMLAAAFWAIFLGALVWGLSGKDGEL